MSRNSRYTFPSRYAGILALVLLPLVMPLHAAPTATEIAPPPSPAIGTYDVTTAELRVARPETTPCTVELFPDREFEGERGLTFEYRPPAGCAGPWGKVVLEADFSVSAGQQYDRTGRILLAGVNLFTGTTAEPGRERARQWHVERDVTDYSALFGREHLGEAMLVNEVNDRLTGRIRWAARLRFYPMDHKAVPKPADLVLPLTDAPVPLSQATPALTVSVSLPRNTTRLQLDLLAMPQQRDEFWYMCMPRRDTLADIAADDRTCGFPFRQTEVRIDGVLAGIAPVFPWIYTGGLYPALWKQVPGIEALDLSPYRVDLTPFAGRLNDGRPHQIGLVAVGARGAMVTTGTLLVWRDPVLDVVAGELTKTPADALDVKIERPQSLARDGSGEAVTQVAQSVVLAGYVDTSRGRVEVAIDQAMSFRNIFTQTGKGVRIVQATTFDTHFRENGPDGTVRRDVAERFPLTIWRGESGADAGRKYDYSVKQELLRDVSETSAREYSRRTHATVDAKAVIVPGETGAFNRDLSSTTSSRLQVRDNRDGCYDRTIVSRDARVASVIDGCVAP